LREFGLHTLLKSDSSRKLSLFAFLYFCEGAPIGLVWWALPPELSSRGIPIETITLLTGSLAIPWALKFLWGPVIDRLRFPGLTYPRWVGFFQIGMAISLVPIVFSGGADNELLWLCLLCHAIFASAQDVATDAWAIQISQSSIRGLLNGVMQMGMIFGRWLFGAGLLMASTMITFEQATSLLLGFLFLSACILLLHPRLQHWGEISNKVQSGATIFKSISGRRVILALVCAISAGLGYEAFGAVVGPFLQSLGYSKLVVGWFYTFSLVAMGAGSLLGGKIADRVGHYRVYMFSILAVFSVIGIIATVAQAVPHLLLLNIAFGLAIYFFIGVMISSSYAFFMDISDRSKDKATTFSLIMAGTNACEAIASFGIGRLIPRIGYPIAFFVMGVFSIASVPFLKMNREKID